MTELRYVMVYEVVSVQVLLDKRDVFRQLHRSILIPTCRDLGINVICCLMAEVGHVGHVVDVYAYQSYESYDVLTSQLEEALEARGYYGEIQRCIVGAIQVEIMSPMALDLWEATQPL